MVNSLGFHVNAGDEQQKMHNKMHNKKGKNSTV